MSRHGRFVFFSFVAAATGLTIVAGVALAVTITGTPGDDRLRGTADADTINALPGNDVVRAFRGNDTALG